MTFEEFFKTVYYTEKKIAIPLLGIRLDKVDFMVKGKLNLEEVKSKIMNLYDKNREKLNKS